MTTTPDKHPANEELRRTDEAIRGLIEAVPAIVYTAEMGESGHWHFVSPQIEAILGYTAEEWTADDTLWFRSIHPDDVDGAMSYEDKGLIGKDAHPPAEYRLRRKDGECVWIYERARLIADDDGNPLWHGVMQDISALKQAEFVVQEKIGQQMMTARLGELAMSGEHPDKLIETVIDMLINQEGMHEVSVWEQEDFKRLRLRHSSNDTPVVHEVPYETDRWPGDRLSLGEVTSIHDWHVDPRVADYRESSTPEVRSSMVAPIGGSDGQFGILSVNSTEPHRFNEQDKHFLKATANILANAIDRCRADESLRHRLLHDPLTGLPNRQLFTDRLETAIEAARKSGEQAGVVFLDLDHFKLINDGVGHEAGDEMLREVAPRLGKGIRTGDTLARFGGDEFAVVLNVVKDEAEAREIADGLLESLLKPITVRGSDHFVSASAGIAIYSPASDPSKSAEELLREADAAMYQAKEMGRAQGELFGQPMRDRAVKRLEVERELRSALESDQLCLYFQPMISLRTGELTAFEALVRWRHPERGLLAPLEFVPIAEESDLITRIDQWVLREATRQLGLWQKRIDENQRLILSVNASARVLRNPRLPQLVGELIEEHDIRPDRLALEITETVLVAGTSTVKTVMNELHGLGIWLALDEFGTGFSSLSYLNEFPIDSLKIDRSFIENLAVGEPKGSAITDAIIQIGKALSMTVVAEAVSSETQLQMVRDLGCQLAQGNLISPPVSTGEATRMLSEAPTRTLIP
ncbi:MAG: EAL domain-containing protein [Solirubrobacterales bacterium]|nr:EAL domain-containing protein [Solirubrobacterales bacterium]